MGWRLQYAVRPHCGRGPSCSLLLLLAEKLHLASVWTSLPIPHFLLLFLRACPQRGAPLLLPFYLGERGSGNTECVSDTLHHIQSSALPCLFSSPPSPACSLPPSLPRIFPPPSSPPGPPFNPRLLSASLSSFLRLFITFRLPLIGCDAAILHLGNASVSGV